MELKITADWVLHRLSEFSYIEDKTYWIATSETIYTHNSNFNWINKALEDLGVDYLSDEYTERPQATGIEYNISCFGIKTEDMERLKADIPETYYRYFNLRYSKEIGRDGKIRKIMNSDFSK